MNTSKQVRPYRWTHLPTIQRDEIAFFNAMAQLTPAHIVPDALPGQILDAISPYIHTSFQWQWTGTSQRLDFQQLERYCLTPTLLIHIVMLPLQQPILIELDPRLASILIDRALGGSGERIEFARPLSEIEKGVLIYLIVKALHQAQVLWGNNVQTEFRFVQMAHRLQDLKHDIAPDTTFYRRELHCGLIGQNGFIRVHIPTDFVTEIASALPNPAQTPEENQLLRKRLNWLSNVPLSGLFRVGMVDLSEADLQDLWPGDTILIRECSVHRREEDGLWEGAGILQFSQKPHFGIRCSLHTDLNDSRIRIQLDEVIQIAEPPPIGVFDRSEFRMEDPSVNPSEYENDPQDEMMGDDNYEEFGPVISDVPVPLIVELGRVECRMKDLAYMRVGQVIELNRSPHEPLHLVVNNQVMGRGELVEVDGQLGIRIIEIAR